MEYDSESDDIDEALELQVVCILICWDWIGGSGSKNIRECSSGGGHVGEVKTVDQQNTPPNSSNAFYMFYSKNMKLCKWPAGWRSQQKSQLAKSVGQKSSNDFGWGGGR